MTRAKARPKGYSPNYRETDQDKAKRSQDEVADLVQDLVDFEDFRQTVLPAIRRDLAAGLTAKQLREKYASLVQARILTEALTSDDSKSAIAAARDVTDRVDGRATEKKEVTHKFDKMTDEELDAVLKSEEADLDDMSKRFDQ